MAQQAGGVEHQRDQQAPRTSVVVEERVNRFELSVRQSRTHHGRERRPSIIDELNQL